jgi:hypothetical protein
MTGPTGRRHTPTQLPASIARPTHVAGLQGLLLLLLLLFWQWLC